MKPNPILASVLTLSCAWVLWVKEYDAIRKTHVWEIENGYETLKECKEGAKQALERTTKVWSESKATVRLVPDDPETISIKVSSGESFLEYFRCFPDTVNPRR